MKTNGKKHPNAKEDEQKKRQKKKEKNNDLPTGKDKIKPKGEPKVIQLPIKMETKK